MRRKRGRQPTKDRPLEYAHTLALPVALAGEKLTDQELADRAGVSPRLVKRVRAEGVSREALDQVKLLIAAGESLERSGGCFDTRSVVNCAGANLGPIEWGGSVVAYQAARLADSEWSELPQETRDAIREAALSKVLATEKRASRREVSAADPELLARSPRKRGGRRV